LKLCSYFKFLFSMLFKSNEFLRHNLTIYLRLASNSQSSWIQLPSARISGIHHTHGKLDNLKKSFSLSTDFSGSFSFLLSPLSSESVMLFYLLNSSISPGFLSKFLFLCFISLHYFSSNF
jgi:hypothetical protein